jgi:hypothetical protein
MAGFLLAGPLSAAPFVAPKEGPVAFRRDRLPIDIDTMIGLSDELVVLAQGQKPDTPQSRRNIARMLALASGLNPANTAAREAVTKLSANGVLTKPEKRDLNRSEARIWHTLTWLQIPESGPDGLALGACLGDVISTADPEHPKAAALREAGEKGNWKNWVPEITEYEDPQLADNKLGEPKMEPPVVVPPAAGTAKILLPTAMVSTPLWTTDKATGTDSLKLLPVKMAAGVVPAVEGVAARPLNFSIDHTVENGPINRVNRVLQGLLSHKFGKLPTDSKVSLNLGEEVSYLTPKDQDAISGAAAVLLGSALSGTEPEGVVIGRIEQDGSFRAGPDFWDRLRALSKSPGGRLVIPTESAEMLPSVLALEEPEFFLKFDILYASNFAELLDRMSKTPVSPLPEVLARFQDVRAKGAGIPIGQYVSNRFVRQRLVYLANEAPFYASPKMLAIQAAGERPTRIPKKILAFELRRALRPIEWIQAKSSVEIDIAELDRSYEAARTEVDKLERYVDSPDRELLAHVREMTTTLRAFSRASRVGVNRENGSEIVAAAFDAMRKAHVGIIAELKTAAGEKEAVEGPEAPVPP